MTTTMHNDNYKTHDDDDAQQRRRGTSTSTHNNVDDMPRQQRGTTTGHDDGDGARARDADTSRALGKFFITTTTSTTTMTTATTAMTTTTTSTPTLPTPHPHFSQPPSRPTYWIGDDSNSSSSGRSRCFASRAASIFSLLSFFYYTNVYFRSIYPTNRRIMAWGLRCATVDGKAPRVFFSFFF